MHLCPRTQVPLRLSADAIPPGLVDAVVSELALHHLPDAWKPVALRNVARHVATEFSNYPWIMEGLPRRAGFEVLSATPAGESILIYHCRKR